MITIGIAICTLISSSRNQVCSDCDLAGGKPVQEEEDFLFWWIVGILILTSALFLSAFLGIYQESMYAKYGKHPQEALYYSVSCQCEFVYLLIVIFSAPLFFAHVCSIRTEHWEPQYVSPEQRELFAACDKRSSTYPRALPPFECVNSVRMHKCCIHINQ